MFCLEQGKGTLSTADGDVYTGLWKAGVKDGPGTYLYASGRADVVKYAGGRDVGEGARWAADRQIAWKLNNGEVVEEISLDEASHIAERLGEPVPPLVCHSSPLLRETGSATSAAVQEGLDSLRLEAPTMTGPEMG